MLALIAGTGALPGVLAAKLRARAEAALVCEMTGFAVTGTGDLERISYRLETLGTLLAQLRSRGVTEVCFAGAIRRPVIDPARIDDLTRPLVPPLIAALRAGDDGALRAVIAIFEAAGFAVRAAHEIAPDLLPATGVLSVARPTALHLQDVIRAQAVHAAMAQVDVGQACVVHQGQVLAVEAAAGTDAMLRGLVEAEPAPPGDPLIWAVDSASDVVAGWADWLSGPEVPRPTPRIVRQGGLFYKAPKPGQDLRADLPVIGPETVTGAVAAGLGALVIAAGGVMVIDLPQVVTLADRHGVVLWVRPVT